MNSFENSGFSFGNEAAHFESVRRGPQLAELKPEIRTAPSATILMLKDAFRWAQMLFTPKPTYPLEKPIISDQTESTPRSGTYTPVQAKPIEYSSMGLPKIK